MVADSGARVGAAATNGRPARVGGAADHALPKEAGGVGDAGRTSEAGGESPKVAIGISAVNLDSEAGVTEPSMPRRTRGAVRIKRSRARVNAT
jgi:hypothetical protein